MGKLMYDKQRGLNQPALVCKYAYLIWYMYGIRETREFLEFSVRAWMLDFEFRWLISQAGRSDGEKRRQLRRVKLMDAANYKLFA